MSSCSCGRVVIDESGFKPPTDELTHCFDGEPCHYEQPLSNKVQMAIEEEATMWGLDEHYDSPFYRPSPGQTWSHVAHRITQVVMRVLEAEGVA